MTKRGNVGYLMLASALSMILLSLPTLVSAQNLNCEVRNSACLPSESEFFRLSSASNAHAETLEGTSGYEWRVCCKSTIAGTSVAEMCPGDATITSLSSVTNAHVETPGTTDYPENVCMDAGADSVLCRTVDGACAASEECIFTQSSDTNAHAADCVTDPYSKNTCCQFFQNDCGAEGQACCGGSLCQAFLSCVDGTCQTGVSPPSCPDASPTNAVLSGVVTNITGHFVEGVTVAVLGKGSTTSATDGFYSISIANADDSTPYDITATHPDYELATVTDFEMRDNQCFTKDFELLRDAAGCNADCTKADGLCRAECQGKGLCSFYSEDTMNACDNAAPGIIDDPNNPGQQILCCTGGPFVPSKANVEICGDDVYTTSMPVVFKGKLVRMVLTLFYASQCEE